MLNSPLTFSFWLSGGPKLRKWYGAPDQFTRDGGDGDLREQENNDAEPGEEEEEDDAGVRDAVLVTDAEGDTGQVYIHMQRLGIP
jgi:hypothetical protein